MILAFEDWPFNTMILVFQAQPSELARLPLGLMLNMLKITPLGRNQDQADLAMEFSSQMSKMLNREAENMQNKRP